MRVLILALIVGIAHACRGSPHWFARATDSLAPLWGDLSPGPYSVGFDVVRGSDESRPFRPLAIDGSQLAAVARPMQISLWYPAIAHSHSSALLFGDYAALLGTEGRAAPLDPASAAAGRQELVTYFVSLGATESAANQLLQTVTAGRRAATRSPGRHPVVVILAGKDGSPVEHVVLAEYLASHGFVVAATPAMGTERRTMAWTATDVMAQVADLEFVFRRLQSQAGADLTRIGLIGFSFGAGSAIIAGQQHQNVQAIVSLDGSIGFRDRIPVYRSMAIASSRRVAPILHFNVLGEERNEIDYLDSLVPRLAVAGLAHADHLAFTSLAMVRSAVPNLALAPFHAVPDPARVHMIAVSLTQAFLAAHLQNRPGVWSAVTAQAPRLGSWPPEAGHLRP